MLGVVNWVIQLGDLVILVDVIELIQIFYLLLFGCQCFDVSGKWIICVDGVWMLVVLVEVVWLQGWWVYGIEQGLVVGYFYGLCLIILVEVMVFCMLGVDVLNYLLVIEVMLVCEIGVCFVFLVYVMVGMNDYMDRSIGVLL